MDSLSRRQSRRFILLSLIVLFISSTAFSLWIKSRQLGIVSAQLHSYYPSGYWADTIIAAFLVGLIIWLGWHLLLRLIWVIKVPSQVLFIDSLCFLVWGLVYLNVPVTICFGLFLALRVACILFLLVRRTYLQGRNVIPQHLMALLIIIFSQSAFQGFVSPFSWDNPMHGLKVHEAHYVTAGSALHYYAMPNAKKFEFSGFNAGFWGAAQHLVSRQFSLLPIAGFLLDLPVIDSELFLRSMLILFFVGFVFSSFGFYFFCLYALNLSAFGAILGGVLFLISNSFYAVITLNCFPNFSSCFLFLPWTLLLTYLGCKKNDPWYSLGAGLVSALQFYLYQPHPEGVVHYALFWGSYGIYIFLTGDHSERFSRRIMVLGANLVGFLGGAAWQLLITFEPIFSGESSIYGHLTPSLNFITVEEGFANATRPILKVFGLFLPLIGIAVANRRQLKQNQRESFLFFLGWAVLSYLLFTPLIGSSITHKLFDFLHWNPIQLDSPGRLFQATSISLLIASLISIEFILHTERFGSIKNTWSGFTVLCGSFVFVWRFREFQEFVLPGVILLASFWVFSRKYSSRSMSHLACFWGVVFSSALVVLWESSFDWRSPKKQGNSQNEKPYLTLPALLTKAKNIPEDQDANLRVLTQRLVAFEKDIKRTQEILYADYANYQEELTRLGLESASELKEFQILPFIEKISPTVDNYYLEHIPRTNFYSHRVEYGGYDFSNGLNYNLPAMFFNVRSRFQPILAATGTNFLRGTTETLPIVDGIIGYDPNFQVGYPPLDSIYIVPKEFYAMMITRKEAEARLGIEALVDPRMRKKFNIAGVDIFVIRNEDLPAIASIKNYRLIAANIHSSVLPPFKIIEDEQSYGPVYLAKRVIPVPVGLGILDRVNAPFRPGSAERYLRYSNKVTYFEDRLMELEQKHDIYLESDTFNVGNNLSAAPEKRESSNSLEISNIAGNKAAFNVNCVSEPCQLVYNMAKIRGWKAFADSIPLKIERANFAFMSVAVPKGKHLVWFEFRQNALFYGMYITVGFYAATLMGFVVRKRKFNHD